MSKILFFNIPAYGHTNPTLPLVAELVRRGEQVIYYSSETFQPAIEQAGAAFRSIAIFFNEQTPVDENLMRFAYTLIQATQEIIANILPDVIADKPDYIIYDSLCIWGKCIAQILQVPAIASVTTLVSPSSLLHLKLLASLPLMIRSFLEGREEYTKFLAISDQLHKTYHIPRPPLADAYNNRAELNIVYSTKQLQMYPNEFNERYKFVGPCIGIRSQAPPFPFDETGNEPVIYISLGTVFNNKVHFYHLCLEAFADLKYRVILSVGSKVDIASLGAIPNNFIVKPFVPQLQVLQRAALFITHGGMNSVSEALYEGVPLLMIPQAADQTFIAQRVQQLGAGKMLHNTKVNAQNLRKAAEEILAQHTFRKASVALGATFRQSGGPKLAVDEIEEFKRKHGI
jgi:MGT family glycosyltransferase